MDDSQPLHPALRGLKTVCRCNNIKSRTIERAIRDGARSVGDIAVRTGATTGYCGGSCTPDIQQMIAELAIDGAPAQAPGITSCGPQQRPRSAAASAKPAAGQTDWWVRDK